MALTRRTFVASAGATALTLAAPAVVTASAGGTRVFDIYRGNSKIGRQTLSVQQSGGAVVADVNIDIKVRIMGIPAYNYTLQSRDVWSGGRLQSLEGRSRDGGTDHSVTVSREGDRLVVSGTGFKGAITGNPGTTTYWAKPLLNRSVWISTQDGQPMKVSASQGGAVEVPAGNGGTTRATVYNIRGDLGRLDLYYDANGEWIGNEFDARGQTARFVLVQRGQDLGRLWA